MGEVRALLERLKLALSVVVTQFVGFTEGVPIREGVTVETLEGDGVGEGEELLEEVGQVDGVREVVGL